MKATAGVPRQVKVVDSAALLELERLAASVRLNQRLDVAWLSANIDAEGEHHLWPALWNVHSHRADPQLVRHLRCQLLLKLGTGEQVLSPRSASMNRPSSKNWPSLLPGPLSSTSNGREPSRTPTVIPSRSGSTFNAQ